MKEYAYGILAVLLLSILLEPFVETMLIFVDKAKIDTAMDSSARLAVTRSVKEIDRANVKTVIQLDALMQRFGESFSKALDLKEPTKVGKKLNFQSNNDKFGEFTIEFVNGLDNNGTYCEIKASTKYKFKTNYLARFSRELMPYTLTREHKYYINIEH
ncbi:MAG: hypothetical protein N2645_15015 [Clostridia bacterium]|nr:hypothetical protein [Clostridia bacterium]